MTAINKDGYLVYISLEFLKANKGSSNLWHKTNPYSIYNINKYLKDNNINTYTISEEYKSLTNKMSWICERCGQVFPAGFGHIMGDKKSTCNECSKKYNKGNKRYYIDKIKQDFKDKGLKPLFNKCLNTQTNVTSLDSEGYLIYTSPLRVNLKDKWVRFGNVNPYTIYNIKNYIKINNMDCELLSEEWLGSKEKLKFRCECGNTFETTWSSFKYQNKIRCDECTKNKSNGEKKVEDWLSYNNIKFENQYTFDECRYKRLLPFDFAIFNKSSQLINLVEVDGIQHFQPVEVFGGVERFKSQKIIDNIKNNYCRNKNINLIRLSYLDINDGTYINKLKGLL